MSPRDDYEYRKELSRRRKARAERQRQAQIERRRLLLRLGAVAVAAIFAGLMIVKFSNGGPAESTGPADSTPAQPPQTIQSQPSAQPPAQSTPADTGTPDETLPQATEFVHTGASTVVHIVAGGDLNVTDAVLEGALTENGYDFGPAFLDVAPILSGADLTLLNFEGNLTGAPYGSAYGSAPMELAKALRTIGVDGVQTANSAAIRQGVLGLQETLEAFRQAGLTTFGTYADEAAFRRSGGYTILEVKGIRIAVVAFTKGMDNLGLPEGSEDCVNLLYTDYSTDYKKVDSKGINAVLDRVREEQPDLTIAMVHWGSEYNDEISSTQKTIKNLMLEGGVDVILGTHPHLVQHIDYDSAAGTLVAYSLGDFYGDAAMAGTNYSILLDLEVTRDNTTGEVHLTGYSYTPIYTLTPEQSAAGGRRVVRIADAMAQYEVGYVGAITESTYSSMDYALGRIEDRITTPVE